MHLSKHSLSAVFLTLTVLACTRQPATVTSAARPTVVATLESLKGEVRRRARKELVWEAVESGADLHAYDTIRTSPGASARVRFSDSTALDLGEESQVVIMERRANDQKELAVAAMRVGKADSRLKASTSEAQLQLRTMAGWITARTHAGSPEEIVFKTQVDQDGNVEVLPVQGTLVVQANGREAQLAQGTTLAMKGLPPAGNDEDFAELPKAAGPSWKEAKAAPTRPKAEPKARRLYQILEPAGGARTQESSILVRVRVVDSVRVYLNGAAIQANASGMAVTEVELEKGRNSLLFMIVGPSPSDVQRETREVFRE